MPTLETLSIADDAKGILNRVHKNLRANAQALLDEINRVPRRMTTQQLADMQKGNARGYDNSLRYMLPFLTPGTQQTKLQDGLAAYQITLAVANQEYTMLRGAVDAELAADVSTDAAIIAAANATLAAVPNIDLVLPA